MAKILTSSRYIAFIAIIGSFLAALAISIIGGFKTLSIIKDIMQGTIASQSTKVIAVSFIEIIDLFLVGTVFYIISLGLYELFVDDSLELMPWLVIHNLDDLKEILINGIIVIMVVYFLGALVSWDNQADLMKIGAPIALVIGIAGFVPLCKREKSSSLMIAINRLSETIIRKQSNIGFYNALASATIRRIPIYWVDLF